MTSSEVYHGFGLKGYRTVATRFEDGKIVLQVEATRRRIRTELFPEESRKAYGTSVAL